MANQDVKRLMDIRFTFTFHTSYFTGAKRTLSNYPLNIIHPPPTVLLLYGCS